MDGIFIAILCILLAGSFIHGAAGIGFGPFAAGLLSLMLTVKDSTLLIMILSSFTSIVIVYQYRDAIRLQRLYRLIIAALIGRIGAFLFLQQYGETVLAQKILGILLIVLVVWLLLNEKKTTVAPVRLQDGNIALVFGLIGGFVGGAFAIGGPIFALYFLLTTKNKEEHTANFNLVAVLQNLFSIGLHGFHRDISVTVLQYSGLGLVIVMFGVYIGLKCFRLLSRVWIQRIACALIVLTGLNNMLFL